MVKMTGNVYSTYDLAFEKAHDKMKELEEDIFICKCEYHSGVEFVLKTRKELIGNGNFIYQCKLPFGHHFQVKTNAYREADKFAERLGKKVNVNPVTYTENGYTLISHYSLCLT